LVGTSDIAWESVANFATRLSFLADCSPLRAQRRDSIPIVSGGDLLIAMTSLGNIATSDPAHMLPREDMAIRRPFPANAESSENPVANISRVFSITKSDSASLK
jgi:hypothetical protein